MKKKIIESPTLTVLMFIIAYLVGTYLIEHSPTDLVIDKGMNIIGALIIYAPVWILKNE